MEYANLTKTVNGDERDTGEILIKVSNKECRLLLEMTRVAADANKRKKTYKRMADSMADIPCFGI